MRTAYQSLAGRPYPNRRLCLPMVPHRSIPERFWSKVAFTESCWLWNGARTTQGYGRFNVSRGPVPAHRWSYEFCVGQIPEGLTIDHLCRVRYCVNPDHLEPVTIRTNILRGEGIAGRNSRKTRCLDDHPFSPENTYVRPRGSRVCRICLNLAMTRYRGKKKVLR